MERPVTLTRSTGLSLALTLAFALPAMAAETPEQELLALGDCALGVGMYQASVKPENLAAATETDRDLAARVSLLEPRLEARANRLVADVGEDRARGIMGGLVDNLKRRAEAEGMTRRLLLDAYRPVVEACIVRASALPAP